MVFALLLVLLVGREIQWSMEAVAVHDLGPTETSTVCSVACEVISGVVFTVLGSSRVIRRTFGEKEACYKFEG